MIDNPMDVLRKFPVRKNRKQKSLFRDAIAFYVKTLGYDCKIEKGRNGAKNIVIGNPATARYLITAHYDTPAGMFLPNLVTPCNFFVYLLYQFLLVGAFVAVAVGVGVLGSLLFDNSDLGKLCAMAAYWALLLMMMFGPANKRNCNDNTSGVVTVLETAKSVPADKRNNVCFILFDLEEAGLVGSSSYQKNHKKQTKDQIIVNLDCVGDGNEIVMFPTKKLKKNRQLLDTLGRICGTWGEKSISLHQKGFSFYPSDQANFPYGVGVGAFHRKKGVGIYYSRIHTHKDTVLEESNVNILREALVSLVSDYAVN